MTDTITDPCTTITTDNADSILAGFDWNRVTSVYSGKHGCACGCRGNHSSRPATMTRIINSLKAGLRTLSETPEIADVEAAWLYERGDMTYLTIETATRSWIAYIDPSSPAAA